MSRFRRLETIRIGVVAIATICCVIGSESTAQRPPADDDPRLRPILLAGRGEVSFPITCTLPESQHYFDAGVALLHGDALAEAGRCFREIQVREPDVLMAYWGLAMTRAAEPDRAAEHLEAALLRKTRASDRERAWFDALAAYYEVTPATAVAHRDWSKQAQEGAQPPARTYRQDPAARAATLTAAWTRITDAHPDDHEAKAFLARHLCEEFVLGRGGQAEAIDAILAGIVAKHPRHPAHVYRVRLWQGSDATRALASALALCRAAPALGGSWLRAGTLLATLGQHGSAASHFAAAMQVYHAKMARDRLPPFAVRGYGEAVAAHAHSRSELGQADAALALAESLLHMPRHPMHNSFRQPASLASIGLRAYLEICRTHGLLEKVRAAARDRFATAGDRFATVHITSCLALMYLQAGNQTEGDKWRRRVLAMRADAWDPATARWIDRDLAAMHAIATGPTGSARVAEVTKSAATGAAPAAPKLESLGPERWQPTVVPGWELNDAAGKSLRLDTYRGRPVLVILYLGFGCLHCVEQLREFHPHVAAYRAAGLDILAIGTDTVKNLRESIGGLPPAERFAYTMLSDRKMRVFREWSAFDFFADVPMHGTFLLDEQGRVLWQDISHQPFDQPVWLLAECQRLLGRGEAKQDQVPDKK